MLEPIDLRGKSFEFDFPRSRVSFEGVRPTKLLTSKFILSAGFHGYGSIIFMKPFMQSFNEEAFQVSFKGLTRNHMPPVIVNPWKIPLCLGVQNNDNLAEVVLAQLGQVRVLGRGTTVEFRLTFNGCTYQATHRYGYQITPCCRLSHFLESV